MATSIKKTTAVVRREKPTTMAAGRLVSFAKRNDEAKFSKFCATGCACVLRLNHPTEPMKKPSRRAKETVRVEWKYSMPWVEVLSQS